jgi:amino acid transporter
MTGGLTRRSIGPGALWVVAVAASSPMTVVAGGIVVTYAATGNVGVPLGFIILGVVLAVLTVGYVAMARHVPHAATAYALSSRGLGGAAGVGVAGIALLAYNCMEIGLFGLIGVTLSGIAPALPWWAWALTAWAAIAVLGALRINLNVAIVTLLLVAELVVIGGLIGAALIHPVDGIPLAQLAPGRLFTDGAGGALAFTGAAFVGYESGLAYGEEAKGHVGAATFAALGFTSVFYALSALALGAAAGVDQVAARAADPQTNLVFSVIADAYGPWPARGALLLFVTSMFGAMLSFHSTVARYLFALGRERVAPFWLSRTGRGRRAGAPVAGSVTQSALALAVILAFAIADPTDPATADPAAPPFPVAVLFTWLSTIGAVGVILLLVVCSLSARRFFRHGGGAGGDGPMVRVVFPTVGAVAGIGVLVIIFRSIGSLLGDVGNWWWLVPTLVAGAGAVGVMWGLWLRSRRPGVYAGISYGRPSPLSVLDPRLSRVDV